MEKSEGVLVLSGPNLDLLGDREPELYGTTTLAEIEARCRELATGLGLEVTFRQSNHEGVMIDAIHEAREQGLGVVINPGGYAHTSVALADALAACKRPVVEVHLTNVHRRERYRWRSYVAGVADAVICGCGAEGYLLALRYVAGAMSNAPRGGAADPGAGVAR